MLTKESGQSPIQIQIWISHEDPREYLGTRSMPHVSGIQFRSPVQKLDQIKMWINFRIHKEQMMHKDQRGSEAQLQVQIQKQWTGISPRICSGEIKRTSSRETPVTGMTCKIGTPKAIRARNARTFLPHSQKQNIQRTGKQNNELPSLTMAEDELVLQIGEPREEEPVLTAEATLNADCSRTKKATGESSTNPMSKKDVRTLLPTTKCSRRDFEEVLRT